MSLRVNLVVRSFIRGILLAVCMGGGFYTNIANAGIGEIPDATGRSLQRTLDMMEKQVVAREIEQDLGRARMRAAMRQPGMQAPKVASDVSTTVRPPQPQKVNSIMFIDNAGNYQNGIYRLGAFFNIREFTSSKDELTVGMLESKGNDTYSAVYGRSLGNSGTRFNMTYIGNNLDAVKGQGKDVMDGHGQVLVLGVTQSLVATDKTRSNIALEYIHQDSETDYDLGYISPLIKTKARLYDEKLDEVVASFSMKNYGQSHLFYQKHRLVRGYHDNDRKVVGPGPVLITENDNYSLYKMNAMYQKRYKHGQSVDVRAEGQWAGGNRVANSRQFYIGGNSSVRGYRECLLASNSGYSAGVEYAVPLKDGKTKAYVFCDYGSLHGKQLGESDHILSSVGLGFKSKLTKHVRADVSLGVPLRRDINSAGNTHEAVSKARAHFTVFGMF